jgi:hypothetical protein
LPSTRPGAIVLGAIVLGKLLIADTVAMGNS